MAPAHTVHIFGREYTVDASARARVDEMARQLDQAMHAVKARDPAASGEQIAVQAALELLRAASPSSPNLREISAALASLARKIERLEAALGDLSPIPSEQSSEQSPANV